jgi:hypothetical protein
MISDDGGGQDAVEFENRWTAAIPDEFDKSDAAANLNQQIFEYWLREEGPCSGCPNHYQKAKCYPSDGMGNPDAELMFVGRVPGSPGEIEDPDTERQVDRDKLAQQSEFDGPSLAAFYDHNIENMYDWAGIATVRNQLFQKDEVLDHELEDIYFTNVKKCHDVVGDDNETARDECIAYLQKELEIVEPDVIVTWGPDAAIGVADLLGYDRGRLPPDAMALPAGDTRPTSDFIGYRMEDPVVITMPHWSGLGYKNYTDIPNYTPADYAEGGIKKVCQDLGELISHLTK